MLRSLGAVMPRAGAAVPRLARALATGYTKEKPMKVVVLGCGWGGFKVAMDLRKAPNTQVTLVAPRNHFLFTPLLCSTTVGTLEFRSIIEPVRNQKHVTYFQGAAQTVDRANKVVKCHTEFDGTNFDVPYDKLVIGVGSVPNTFGVPGVEEHCHFLKELSDSRAIRRGIISMFEQASSPTMTPEDRKKLLHFVVVGGGPTGVEFCAELYDFVNENARRVYPQVAKDVEITLLEASEILGAFDEKLRVYTKDIFRKENIDVVQAAVTKVQEHKLTLATGEELPFGLCVWSTGVAPRQFIRDLDLPKQDPSGRLLVDMHLQSLGDPDILALGDCAIPEAVPTLPPTAQNAQQEGAYLARALREMANGRDPSDPDFPVFTHRYRGMLAYVGSWRALSDLPIGASSGFASWLFWRSAYMTQLVSWKNKVLVPMEWFKTFLFGRDTSLF